MPKTTGKKLGRGRPPTPPNKVAELKNKILELLNDDDPNHKSIRSVTKELKISHNKIYEWEAEDSDFRERSARAREATGDYFKDLKLKTVEEVRMIIRAAAAGKIKIPQGVIEGYKIIIQEYEREAATRNKKYSEKHSVDISGGLDLKVPDGLGAVYERFGINPKD